jgi:hypothetical protein
VDRGEWQGVLAMRPVPVEAAPEGAVVSNGTYVSLRRIHALRVQRHLPGYSRYDTTRPHFPCPGAHTHVYTHEYNQNPQTCQCFMKKTEKVICD